MKSKIKLIVYITVTLVVLFLSVMYLIDYNRMRNNEPVFFSTWGHKYTSPKEQLIKCEDTQPSPISKSEDDANNQQYFNGKVVMITDETILVECTDTLDSIFEVGRLIILGNEVVSVSGLPELKENDYIRIVYNEDSAKDSDPTTLDVIFAVYLLDKHGEIVVPEISSPGKHDLSELKNSFVGTIIEESLSYIIVEPNTDEYEYKLSDRITVLFTDEHKDYLYGEGRKIVIRYNDFDAEQPYHITTHEILPDGYEDFEISVIPSSKISKKLILSSDDFNGFISFGHISDTNLYYSGVESVNVTVNGETIPLTEALESGKISLTGLIRQCNTDVNNGVIEATHYSDGGSKIYKYDNYTVIRYHTFDGNHDIYIGNIDMDINVSDLPVTLPGNINVIEDEWGLCLTGKSFSETGATLAFVQTGGTPTGELIFGEEYILETKEKDEWIKVEYLPHEYDIAWNSIAYLIKNNDTTEFSVNWEWLYGKLSLGKNYRIGKEVINFRKTGDFDQKIYYAEFAIIE